MTFDPQKRMMKLRGKDYLEVKWRIVWFREEHPNGLIDTEVVSQSPLLVKAAVYNGDRQKMGTGHGGANAGDKKVVWTGREFEKAETAAIGRALAHAGYGTQFTGEDEGDYLADSPVGKQLPPNNGNGRQKANAPHWTTDSARLENFQAYAKDNGLEAADVHKALGVKRVADYTGTPEQAAAAVKDFAAKKAEETAKKAA